METTTKKLSQDVLCFIRNYYTGIITLILVTTLIQTGLDYILLPKKEEFMFIRNFIDMSFQSMIKELSSNQQYILLKLSIANSASKLLGNTFLLGSTLILLHLISTNKNNIQHFNISKIIKLATPIFSKLLLLIFCSTLLIQLGLMMAIIPGILLAIIISLTPIIVVTDNASIAEATYLSIKISSRNIHLIIPPILLWFLIKIICVLIFIHHTYSWIFTTKILVNSFNNMLSVIVLIYLYRLYMIIKTM